MFGNNNERKKITMCLLTRTSIFPPFNPSINTRIFITRDSFSKIFFSFSELFQWYHGHHVRMCRFHINAQGTGFPLALFGGHHSQSSEFGHSGGRRMAGIFVLRGQRFHQRKPVGGPDVLGLFMHHYQHSLGHDRLVFGLATRILLPATFGGKRGLYGEQKQELRQW